MAIPPSDTAGSPEAAIGSAALQSLPNATRLRRTRGPARWHGLVLLLLGIALVACQAWYLQPGRRMSRALVTAKTGDLDEAQYELLELAGASYEAHSGLLAGKLQIAKGRPTKALDELALAVDQPETNLPALVLAGDALRQLERFIEAVRVWSLAIQEDPDNVEAHRRLAAAYYELGAVWVAAHHMSEVVRLAPDDPRAYWLLGMIHREHGDAATAADQFRAALERNPKPEDRLAICLDLAGVLHRLHQDEDALSYLDECRLNVRVWQLRGECQFALGRDDEAAASLREALLLSPSDRPALLLKSRMALQAGDAQAAADIIEEGIKLHPGSAAMHFALGQAYRRLNRGNEASTQEAAAEALWAKEGQMTNQIEAAVENPDDAELRFEVGRLATQVDQPEMALQWLKAALLIDPNHVRARSLLARLSPKALGHSPNGPRRLSSSAP